jgi:hypothetical protein
MYLSEPTVPLVGATAVKDQVHIRNSEAAELARTLARQTGKTISEVVLDALRQYRPREHRKRGIAEPEIPIESLYDEATGLPK